MRGAAIVALLVLIGGLLLVVAGVAASPLAQTCAPPLEEDVCTATVEASLERGLEPVHPLILSSHVEPGPAAGASELGHKATVTFELLGVPGPTSVRMYLDLGGHWGGAVDRSDPEIMLWALAPLIVAGLAAVAILGLAWRRRAAPTG